MDRGSRCQQGATHVANQCADPLLAARSNFLQDGVTQSEQPWRLGMETLINFFALRPTFTFFGLKVVWYIYLANTLLQAYVGVSGVFRLLAQRGISWEAWSPNFFPLVLGIVAQLALVRLFLEIGAIILSTARTRT